MIASPRRRVVSVARAILCGLALATACDATLTIGARADEPAHSAELDAMIVRQAKRHGVPESLVRRIVMRESRYNARARNHSFWGLMQISYPTARSMGFKGNPSELLNPVVNLTYAVPYLANAFIVAGKREDAAVRLYAHGYYEAARSRGLLSALRTAESRPLAGDPNMMLASTEVAPQPQPDYGPFGALFGSAPSPQPAPVDMAAASGTLPQGKPSAGESADLVLDKRGAAAPPRKWTRDGGVSVVARGEQRVEQVAAYGHPDDDVSKGGRHVRSRKNTAFASLELPGGGQAYAAPGAQSSALAQTAPQAAITQATSGAVDGQQVAGGTSPAPSQAEAVNGDGAAMKPTRKERPKRHVTKVAHAKATRTATAQKADDAGATASEQAPAPQ